MLGLEDTIRWTVDWYRAQLEDRSRTGALIDDQLIAFEARVEAARAG